MHIFKESSFLVISILLFVSIGCNLGSTEQSDPSSDKTGAGQNVEQETASTETEDSEHANDVTPDINFEDDSDTPSKTVGSRSTVVKFKKGSTSRSYKNSVVRAQTHTYVLGASKGQNMSVKVSALEDNAVFYIKTPGGGYLGGASKSEPTDSFSRPLPVNGKYQIVVSATRGNATYNISFDVKGDTAAPADDNSATIESVGGLTTVVKFKKGATSAVYKNAVIRGQRNKYILGASGGQLMSVSISSVENNAVFDVQAPGGKILTSEKRSWSGQLPANGKYRIIVGGTRGNATYTVRFAVR